MSSPYRCGEYAEPGIPHCGRRLDELRARIREGSNARAAREGGRAREGSPAMARVGADQRSPTRTQPCRVGGTGPGKRRYASSMHLAARVAAALARLGALRPTAGLVTSFSALAPAPPTPRPSPRQHIRFASPARGSRQSTSTPSPPCPSTLMTSTCRCTTRTPSQCGAGHARGPHDLASHRARRLTSEPAPARRAPPAFRSSTSRGTKSGSWSHPRATRT